jgi:hypothetical protein
MQTLAYRIQTQQIIYPKHIQANWEIFPGLETRMQALRTCIRRETKVNLTNVANYYAQHSRTLWDMDDIPNWAPPFGCAFIEWTEPKDWVMDGVLHHEEHNTQVGVQIMSADFTRLEEERRIIVGLQMIRAFAGAGFNNPLDKASEERVAELIPESRWLLCCDLWMAFMESPCYGRTIWLGVQAFLLIDKDGRCLHHFYVATLMSLPELKGMGRTINTMLHILGLGFSFCHCKNVTKSEETITSNPRAVKREGAPPTQTYYVLNIMPMKEVLRKQGSTETSGLQRALHICRGHFATYSEDAPLFGKYAGGFWIPYHVRGNPEKGQVIKDYAV